MPKLIVSFGFNKGVPTHDDHTLVIDVRTLFGRNPYHDRTLRYLRGTDKAVQDDIKLTPYFDKKYAQLKEVVVAHDGPVFLGCTGGHHRSVYLAERLASELGVPVKHVHINL